MKLGNLPSDCVFKLHMSSTVHHCRTFSEYENKWNESVGISESYWC